MEKKVLEDPIIVGNDSFGPVKKLFCTLREDYDDISNQIDFIICPRGQGLEPCSRPLCSSRVLCLQSCYSMWAPLGFLTPFNFENFQTQVTQVIQGESPRSGAHTQL